MKSGMVASQGERILGGLQEGALAEWEVRV